jgi:DNA-binding MarR family transcriptional regulator
MTICSQPPADTDAGPLLVRTAELRRLEVLAALERNPAVSQHTVAARLATGVSTVNGDLQRGIGAGWITVQGDNHMEKRYFLTDSGREELQRLRRRWVREVLGLIDTLETQLAEVLDALGRLGTTDLVVAGPPPVRDMVERARRRFPDTAPPVSDELPGRADDVSAATVGTLLLIGAADPAVVADLTAQAQRIGYSLRRL